MINLDFALLWAVFLPDVAQQRIDLAASLDHFLCPAAVLVVFRLP
jgi:hypothetical protein